MLLRLAIKILIRALKNDPVYKNAWKCNIAMSFYDAVLQLDKDKRRMSKKDLHTAANKAADYFLNTLMR